MNRSERKLLAKVEAPDEEAAISGDRGVRRREPAATEKAAGAAAGLKRKYMGLKYKGWNP
jgi:hypothetical protein